MKSDDYLKKNDFVPTARYTIENRNSHPYRIVYRNGHTMETSPECSFTGIWHFMKLSDLHRTRNFLSVDITWSAFSNVIFCRFSLLFMWHIFYLFVSYFISFHFAVLFEYIYSNRLSYLKTIFTTFITLHTVVLYGFTYVYELNSLSISLE